MILASQRAYNIVGTQVKHIAVNLIETAVTGFIWGASWLFLQALES